MKSILSFLTVLAVSIFAVSVAHAVEQSFAVKCRYFNAENTAPSQRDGDLLLQIVNDVASIRLRTSQAEMNITVRNGFEQNQRGSEPTVQALEMNSDYTPRFIYFFRSAVAIQYKDISGKPTHVMSCQGVDIARIADRLLGFADGNGPMVASMERLERAGGADVARIQPAPATVVAPAVPVPAAPAVPVPVAPPVIVPDQVVAPMPSADSVGGLPRGMAENLDYLQGQN